MLKITAFIGSARTGYTLRAVQQLQEKLQALGRVDFEIVPLGDYRIKICRGCKVCFERGEEHCPLQDDRDRLIEKMTSSDGVIFASPNYSFHVSSLMKSLIDRLSFNLHRPCFFGKISTSIVVQGMYGGGKIVKYLDFVSKGMGFNNVKGICMKTIEPMSDRDRRKFDAALTELARRVHRGLAKPPFPKPGLFALMIFRISRTKIRCMLDEGNRDWRYYLQQGWFDSDFYYPTRLSAPMSAAGRLFDYLERRRHGRAEHPAGPPPVPH